jgi:hypothetical protein
MAFEYENIPVQKVIVSNDWEDSERESVATQI